MIFKVRGRIFRFPRRPLVVGVLDLPVSDSSVAARRDIDDALLKAHSLVSEGADVVEIGIGVNTDGREEAAAVTPLEVFAKEWTTEDKATLLSIRTARSEVAETVLRAGADLLYAVGASDSGAVASICARAGAGLLLGGRRPVTGAWAESGACLDFWEERVRCINDAGFDLDSLAIAPQGGPETFAELRILKALKRPVQVTAFPEGAPIDSCSAISVACVTHGLLEGAHLIRVRNVRAAMAAVKIIGALG
jgi:dihydropteroate synthase